MYGVTEIDGYEVEEIESHEAPGFYYLVISLNDKPVERWKLTRAGATKVPLNPKVKGGYGRIRNFLSSAVNLLRGLVGF